MNKSFISNKKYFKNKSKISIAEWNRQHYKKNSVCAPEMDDHTALKILFAYLIPDGDYIPYSCNDKQANTEYVNDILQMYSKRYEIERNNYFKKKKLEEKKEQIDSKIKTL